MQLIKNNVLLRPHFYKVNQMKKILSILLLFFVCSSINAQNAKPAPKPAPAKPVVQVQRLVEIKTNYGTIVIKLYNETPQHRDNFIKLVKEGFYDSTLFHRVIETFMIQGGDPQSKGADSGQVLGMGSAPGNMIPAEFNNALIHKKGALAMARTDNPEKASSNCQFYIVQGKPYTDIEINQMECAVRQNNPAFTYTDAQRKTYKTVGGTPFLDQNYTVFGEVVKGLDIVDKIAAVPKDQNDRPFKDVLVLKMRMLN